MARSLLCATVTESTVERTRAVMRVAAARADLLEVRLDALPDADPAAVLAGAPGPVVVTCRARRDGGGFDGSEAERLALLRRGAEAGADYVDVEADALDAFGDPGPAELILSQHDFAGTPEDLETLAAGLVARKPAVAKLVTTARGPADVLRVLRLLDEHARGSVRLAAHTMGPAGFPGRILAARFGSAIVYGAARCGAAGAPGQPTLRALVDDYRLDRDVTGARVLLLLGGKLGHSVSPRMMNRVLADAGIDALYVPWEGADPARMLAAFPEIGAIGAAVTIPLKETIVPLLDGLDPAAARIGAVNTVYLTRDGLRGANTDAGGALDAIGKELPDLEGLRALVLGAGGAARALVFGLVDAGARVTIVNRTAARAEALARESGATAAALDAVDPAAIDLLVNTTPVGQWPEVEESPVPQAYLRPRMTVFDVVYNPEETRLLASARAAGCRTIPGIEMLAHQGARQVRAWLGVDVDPVWLAEEGRAALDLRRRTVLLIGMRGAGKTTVGEIVAARLDRPFTDVDRRIEEAEGRTIDEIFRTDGEPAFRRMETTSLEAALAEQGAIVAAGGGILESGPSREAIERRAPRVVYLEASAETLAGRIRDSGRPSLTGLPPDEEVGAVLDLRRAAYLERADVVVDAAAGGPEEVADAVLEALGH